MIVGCAVATGLPDGDEHLWLRLLPMSDRDKDTEILAVGAENLIQPCDQ